MAPPRVKAARLVVERRERSYPRRVGVHPLVVINEKGNKKTILLDDPGGEGHETVREIIVCPSCTRNSSG